MKIADRDVNARLRLQNRILEMIALRGDPNEILAELCLLVQELIPSSVASLMLVDKSTGQLNVRSAPGIPEETRKCFDGLAMSPTSGSCGTAAGSASKTSKSSCEATPPTDGIRHAESDPASRRRKRMLCPSAKYRGRRPSVSEFSAAGLSCRLQI